MGGKGSGRKRKESGCRVSFAVSCTNEEKMKVKSISKSLGKTISRTLLDAVFEKARELENDNKEGVIEK